MMSHIRGTHDQAQLSRSKRGPEADESTAPYTYKSGSQQGKVKTQRTQEMVVLYAQPYLSAIRLTSLL